VRRPAREHAANMLVDYMLKAGIGRARFGQLDRAERLLASALRIADEAGLHEFTFRIERIQAGLATATALNQPRSPP